MTNREVLDTMSDKTLAKFLFYRGNCQEYCSDICAYQDQCECEPDDYRFCISQIVKWLNSDAMELEEFR